MWPRHRFKSGNTRGIIGAPRIPTGSKLFISFNELWMTFIVSLFQEGGLQETDTIQHVALGINWAESNSRSPLAEGRYFKPSTNSSTLLFSPQFLLQPACCTVPQLNLKIPVTLICALFTSQPSVCLKKKKNTTAQTTHTCTANHQTPTKYLWENHQSSEIW